MINLTPIAAKKFQEKITERKQGIGIRVGIKSSGCNGFSYILEYADTINPDDEVFESHYVTIVSDKKSLIFIKDLVIDFVKEGLNEGFVYINPNEKGQCGCGESFNV